MQNESWRRICDMCNQPYDLNNRQVPRIMVIKKINLSDIESKDFVAEPDYCDICILVIMKMLQRKNTLRFKLLINRNIANRITSK